MDRGVLLLQAFREDIRRRLDVVRRSVGASDILVEPGDGGEFSVRVIWKTADGDKFYVKQFTRTLVFGSSITANPHTLRVVLPGCMHIKNLIHEVLQARGVV